MGGILGGALGSLLGGGQNSSPITSILEMALNSQGGLGGLVGKFTQGGMGNMINSWIGTGPNPPITPTQVGSIFSIDELKALANKHFGGDVTAATGAVAQHLPDIIDKITPNGTLPQGNDWMSNIGGLLGGLLK